MTTELPDGFHWECTSCGAKQVNPDPDTFTRLCKAEGCKLHIGWVPDDYLKLASFILQWNEPLNVDVLPSMTSDTHFDFFARWADRENKFPSPKTFRTPQQNFPPDRIKRFLPYSTDFLHARGLHCGFPVCWRTNRLESWTNIRKIFVLDFSTYPWSHTLKDPRSWAIINTAQEQGIRHLALWTAGNAGFSLAKLVRHYNHFLYPNKRLRVYALYDVEDESMVDVHVSSTLKRWGGVLVPVPGFNKEILEQEEIRDRVKDEAQDYKDWDQGAYWDVTDGWEAVGMVMYRLIASQVIRDLQPTHIITPLGTGNLTFGILLGVKDCVKAGVIEEGSVTVIAVVPDIQNVVEETKRRLGWKTTPFYYQSPHQSSSSGKPIMPKIVGTYTPLIASIRDELEEKRLTYYPVTLDEQMAAARKLFGGGAGRRIYAEPSSIAAFAASPNFDETLRGKKDQRILIINSGFGLLSNSERNFLAGFIR